MDLKFESLFDQLLYKKLPKPSDESRNDSQDQESYYESVFIEPLGDDVCLLFWIRWEKSLENKCTSLVPRSQLNQVNKLLIATHVRSLKKCCYKVVCMWPIEDYFFIRFSTPKIYFLGTHPWTYPDTIFKRYRREPMPIYLITRCNSPPLKVPLIIIIIRKTILYLIYSPRLSLRSDHQNICS